MPMTAQHIDTCLACYLTDHHNRDGEALLGVFVDGRSTIRDVREGLDDELNSCALNLDDFNFHDAEAAIAELFAGRDPSDRFDPELETFGDPADDEYDTLEDDRPQAWFLLTWEEGPID